MRPPSYLARLRPLLHTPAARLVSSLLLGLLLLLATLHNEALYALFDGWWYRVGSALGLGHWLPGLFQSSPASLLLHHARSVPAVGLYSVCYLGLCLGLLFLLVPAGPARRLVLPFYGGAGLATGLLLLGSQVSGSPTLAVLASQLLHFIVSPLPVIMLAPLLRWMVVPPTATRSPR